MNSTGSCSPFILKISFTGSTTWKRDSSKHAGYRFSNGIFEPIWNQNFIHHVEIISAETLGVEDRGGYYDHCGTRDMAKTTWCNTVGLIAMEPPVVIEANAIRNEMLKVFQSMRPLRKEDIAAHLLRGQYTQSHIGGELVNLREENGVEVPSLLSASRIGLRAT